jgi:ABC-type transport system involved in cytochrome c biogenesis permease component
MPDGNDGKMKKKLINLFLYFIIIIIIIILILGPQAYPTQNFAGASIWPAPGCDS